MSSKKTKKKTSHEDVSADIVYQETYEEMRRFRDYELNSSNWNTAILLALAGAFLTLKYTNIESPISILLSQNCFIKFGLSLLTIILGANGIFLAYYVSSRYNHLRTWTTENLEPAWKDYVPPPQKLRPIHAIMFVQVIIAVIILAAIWSP